MKIPGSYTYRVSSHVGVNVLQCTGEMDQEKVNVSKTPSFILLLGHSQRMFFSVIVVPQLGRDENLLALDEPVRDGFPDAIAGFFLVLVVVCSVKESVSDFDGLCG